MTTRTTMFTDKPVEFTHTENHPTGHDPFYTTNVIQNQTEVTFFFDTEEQRKKFWNDLSDSLKTPEDVGHLHNGQSADPYA